VFTKLSIGIFPWGFIEGKQKKLPMKFVAVFL
jgi:hypothetical protein